MSPSTPREESHEGRIALHQVVLAARGVAELARLLPGRVAELGLKVPSGVPRGAVVEALLDQLAQLGLEHVQVNVSAGGRRIELDAVEFEP